MRVRKSSPSTTGMARSSTITSGFVRPSSSSPSAPFGAAPHRLRPGSRSMASVSARRTATLSSTTRTRSSGDGDGFGVVSEDLMAASGGFAFGIEAEQQQLLDQRLAIERFHQVLARAGVQGHLDLLHLALGGDHHDRHVAELLVAAQ